jgi:hypothetical protein
LIITSYSTFTERDEKVQRKENVFIEPAKIAGSHFDFGRKFAKDWPQPRGLICPVSAQELDRKIYRVYK